MAYTALVHCRERLRALRTPIPVLRQSATVSSARIGRLVCALLLLSAIDAAAIAVRPSESVGDFHAHMDLHETIQKDGRRDLVLLFSVANSELTFAEELGGVFKGSLHVDAALKGFHGSKRSRGLDIPLTTHTRSQAASKTLYQVFVVTLEDVGVGGLLECRLEDTGKPPPRIARRRDGNPQAEIVVDWQSQSVDLQENSLFISAPIFLAGAPTIAGRRAFASSETVLNGDISSYLHPNRRYGLESETLQLRFDVSAWRTDPRKRSRLPKTLLIQVLARDLDYALRDTLILYDDPLEMLNSGGHANISWELDVNKLPTGIYQLSCAPLDGFGNAWLAEFDVQWTLAAYSRSDDEVERMGRLVLTGDRLARFKDAGPDQRAIILSQFWEDIDPDPTTEINEAVIEFKSRMAYVEKHLGGFGWGAPIDDRGLVYLYLGPPDEIEKRDMPASDSEFEDALDVVYNSYAPIRSSVTGLDGADKKNRSIHESVQSRQQKRDRLTRTDRFKGFQIWYYEEDGDQLFLNAYSNMEPGSRFLFLLRLGGSVYKLESTNVFDAGAIGN